MVVDTKVLEEEHSKALILATEHTDMLRAERDQIVASLNLRAWGGLRSAVPAGQRRVLESRYRTITRELRGIANLNRITELGYAPFKPNPKWIMGLADSDDRRVEDHAWITGSGAISVDQGSTRYFNAPMPAEVIAKWAQAKRTGLFDLFMVSSPDSDKFATARPRPIWTADPILIGFIATQSNASITGFTGETYRAGTTENVVGFLIAQWDLQHDLEKSG